MEPLVTSDLLSTRGGDDLTREWVASQADEDAEDVVAAIDEVVAEENGVDGASEASLDPPGDARSKSTLRQVIVDLPRSTLVSPRSVYEPFEPPAPHRTEAGALQALLRADSSQRNDDFIELELESFACYIITDPFPCEMRSLHDHATRTGKQAFYFDGTLRIGDLAYFVRRVQFEQIPLGNYGRNPETGGYDCTVGDQIWIRSQLNAKKEIYYQLKRPALEYRRFHEAFLWVADLAKHMFDFCEHLLEDGRDVYLCDFREEFGWWLRQLHEGQPAFLTWYGQRRSDDFRQSIIANEPFLRKEMHGTFDARRFLRLHVFQEIAQPFTFYKSAGNLPKKNTVPPTIVTPYIYDCFSRLQLGGLLEPVKPSVGAEEATRLSWRGDRPNPPAFTRSAPTSPGRKSFISSIKAGDLISTPPDAEESGTKWMTERPDKKWYGLVQKVLATSKGERRFDVIWLYQPEDTPCCSMRYPWPNELFLSEHCTCDQSLVSKVGARQVLNVHSVEWFGSPDTEAEFFVRQTYRTAERRFVTLEEAHLQCNHDKETAAEYTAGETVLALTPGSRFLEPCELLGYSDSNQIVRLRRFKRRREFDAACAPNELVYTENTEDELHLSADRIATRCIIRCYSPGEPIPTPYNRDGTGNAFFVTHRLLRDGALHPLGPDNRPRFREGFDPNKAAGKLRGLDLFCGGGNFGRGLEDGGAVDARWANDLSKEAIHTYMANTKHPGSVAPFLGSIDDLLLNALEGNFGAAVPRPGEVDVISGGSPCPGFSLITTDKTTLHQIKNRSLVASFASCVDFWRPRWGLLENVRTIVQSKNNRTEDFFSQLICALVGMGYQCQIILGEAWSYGCPQRRVRAFLYFAAPGVNLPEPPYPSHSTPTLEFRSDGRLGRMTNDEPYVERVDRPTAFKYVTAGEATADLPDILDAKPDTCIPFPDHRLSIPISSGGQRIRRRQGQGQNRRTQIFNIPIRPYGLNFSRAYYTEKTPEGEADMFEHERDAYPPAPVHRTTKISRGWGRAHPHRLFGTVTTFCHMTDARIGGNLMHWDQPRPLSVMEIRRAQGVPDDEVVLGDPADQWRMLGNGVARGISTALGLALREAFVGTLYEADGDASGVRVAATEDECVHMLPPWEEGQDGVPSMDTRRGDAPSLSIPFAAPELDVGGAGTSRSSSHTPGLDTASTSVTSRFASTPAASLAGMADDVVVINGKHPLSRVLSDDDDDEQQQPPPPKRPRLDELQSHKQVVAEEEEEEEEKKKNKKQHHEPVAIEQAEGYELDRQARPDKSNEGGIGGLAGLAGSF